MVWMLPSKPLVEPPLDTARRAEEERVTKARRAAAEARLQHVIRDYRAASRLAGEVFTPAVARAVRSELDAWCDWGYCMGVSPVVAPLYAEVMAEARAKGLA